MKRVLAFVAAVAMVVGALYVRGRLDDDDGETPVAVTDVRVVCSTELVAACDALDDVTVTVEDAGLTAARLVEADGDDVGVDAWIVPSRWPELVDVRRDVAGRDALFDAGDDAVAATRVAMVAWNDALSCGAEPSWRCVGDAAAQGLKPGFDDPTRDGVALLVLGHLAVSFFGTTDLSTIDLDDPAFDDWFTRLVDAVPRFVDDPLTLMLVQGPSLYDVVGVSEADADRVLSTAARRNEVEVLYPAPVASVGAMVVARRGVTLPASIRQDAAEALAAGGWARGEDARGLPSAGFLDALVERWEQLAR